MKAAVESFSPTIMLKNGEAKTEVFTSGEWSDSTPTEVAIAVAAVSLVASGVSPLIIESSFSLVFRIKNIGFYQILKEMGF